MRCLHSFLYLNENSTCVKAVVIPYLTVGGVLTSPICVTRNLLLFHASKKAQRNKALELRERKLFTPSRLFVGKKSLLTLHRKEK